MQTALRFPISIAVVVMASSIVTSAFAAEGVRPQTLAKPESFAGIADPTERSAALFSEAGKVLTSPRCLNCHPPGDRPLQGEDGRAHSPPVSRGPDGFGLPAMRCSICHQKKNFKAGRVPGAHHWHLAPRSMAWGGKTVGEICAQLKDPERNGGRSLDEIVAHVGKDPLVVWAWAPGAGRQPAPGTQAETVALLQAWVDTGAACPD